MLFICIFNYMVAIQYFCSKTVSLTFFVKKKKKTILEMQQFSKGRRGGGGLNY